MSLFERWKEVTGFSKYSRGMGLEIRTKDLGRVIEVQRDRYLVASPEAIDGQWCTVAGRFRHEHGLREEFPTTGDFVRLRGILAVDGSHGTIDEVLPRRTLVSRPDPSHSGGKQLIAANVDKVLIVTSCNQEFNARRLERYVLMVWDSGATPLAFLSKADLAADMESMVRVAEQMSVGSRVLAVSAANGAGIDLLAREFSCGETLTLVGSSGVGKSSLINALLEGGVESRAQRTGDIRSRDGKGRHTTSTRTLRLLPTGALVINTPGMRELGVLAFGDALDQTFSDITALALQCRFGNCSHQEDPGCAVMAAVESGNLTQERLNSYRKLEKESRWQSLRSDKAALSEERKRWKKRNKEMRAFNKQRRNW